MSTMFKFFGVAILVMVGLESARAVPDISGFEGFPVVADRELDQMRGGFETVSNGVALSFSFGFERTTFVNGQLVSTSNLVIPSLSALNSGAVSVTGFDHINVIQIGEGNSFTLPDMRNLSTQFMTLIQNTKDNQETRNVTVINASVTSRDFLRSLAVQHSLNRMTLSSFH